MAETKKTDTKKTEPAHEENVRFQIASDIYVRMKHEEGGQGPVFARRALQAADAFIEEWRKDQDARK